MEVTNSTPPQQEGNGLDVHATKVEDSNDHATSSMHPTNALTPPTSEEMNHNNDIDDGSSDLSELDLDPENEEEIVPDHYYGGGKVPVFKPVCRCYYRCTHLLVSTRCGMSWRTVADLNK